MSVADVAAMIRMCALAALGEGIAKDALTRLDAALQPGGTFTDEVDLRLQKQQIALLMTLIEDALK